MTPEEKLCSPWWKALHSLWLVPAVVGVGIVTWVGFLFIGIRGRRKLWAFFGVAYLVAFVALMFMLLAYPTGASKEGPPENPENLWTSWVMFAFWVVGIIHSALTNKAWLRRRAYLHADRAIAKAAAGRAAQAARAGSVPIPPAPVAARLKPDAAGLAVASHAERVAAPVEVNTAGASALVNAGFTPEEASAIVSARSTGGHYAQISDLIARAGIAPHRFVLVRSNLVASHQRSDGTVAPPTGRRLDL